jgi:signal transduction histidine kinase
MVPSGDGEVVAISRDFTRERRAEAEQQRLAAEQAALRRVATLVAGNAAPEQVFQTVTEEVCRLVGLRTAVLHRFEDARTSTIVGKFGEPTGPYELGNTNELEVGSALQVLRTGAPARSNYDGLVGSGAVMLRTLGFHGSMGVPITVAGVTWGALVVALRAGESLPLETERRLQAFAELVGLAVASAHARDELSASRLRIVEASDAERRRIERNLHDGAQQRLMALAFRLRRSESEARLAPEAAPSLIAEAEDELLQAVSELRELAHGIHPAVLTTLGLGEAIRGVAARSTVPVQVVDVPDGRLGDVVEGTAYFVVVEAISNAQKHARASSIRVRVVADSANLRIEVSDDGVGGAVVRVGSGLEGLRDRVEGAGGTARIESPPTVGTRITAVLPLG